MNDALEVVQALMCCACNNPDHHDAAAVLTAASGPWAEQLDAARTMEPHEKELRKLWREVAEKGIEQGVDWPRIVTTLFGDIDAALARNAELQAEAKAADEIVRHYNGTCEYRVERDALRAELDNLRETLAQKVEAEMRRLQTGSEAPEFDEGMAVAAAIVRGSGDE